MTAHDEAWTPSTPVRHRFLVLSMYFPPEVGAPQTRLAALTATLVAQGHAVEVVTAMPNYPTGRVFAGYRHRLTSTEVRNGVVVRRVPVYASMGSGTKRLMSYASFTASCLFGLIRAKRPTVVFVESPPLFLAVPGLLAARAWGALAVFNVADLWPDAAVEIGALRPGRTLRLAHRLEQWAYRRADVVNAVTDSVRRVLADDKLVPPEKLVDLPNGVDTSVFHPAHPSERTDEPAVIVYAGTTGFIHDAHHLIEAMASVRDLPVRLAFYASGSLLPNLIEFARSIHTTNVDFHDPVPIADLAPILRTCLAGVVTLADLPMAEKTRPSKMFPVMASGRPVLFCGSGEGARLVLDNRAGIVVANDAHAIAEGIRILVRDPERSDGYGRAGRQFVEEHLSWERICAGWLTEIERLSAR